jgi:hypothetical protein
MKLISSRSRRFAAVGMLIAASAVLVSVFVFGAGAANTGAWDPNASAQSEVGALQNPATNAGVSSLPSAIGSVGADVAPAPGSVHLLFDADGVSLYAWPYGSSRVCRLDTNGNAGCIASFALPFSYTIADPDYLGKGSPTYVLGLVPDGVTSVDVVVDGKSQPAQVKNNVAYYRLEDASTYPDAIQAFEVTFADGTTQTIQHDITLPRSVKP